MNVVVVTPPDGALVDLADAKSHLRVEHGDHDTLIAGYLAACADWLDGPAGILGQALGLQTLRLDEGAFHGLTDCDLPCGPVQSVGAITYLDGQGVEQTVAADVYEVAPGTNRVRLVAGKSWPAYASPPVSVTYVTGYPDDGLPASIRAAILLHLSILYDQPEDKALAALERARDALLSPKRKRRV